MRAYFLTLVGCFSALTTAQASLNRLRKQNVELAAEITSDKEPKSNEAFEVWGDRELRASMSMSMSMNEICPPLTNQEREDAIIAELSRFTDPKVLKTPGTPQNDALIWLLEEDQYKVCPNDKECPRKVLNRWLMALLYYSTEGEGWTNCGAEGDGSSCDTNGIGNVGDANYVPPCLDGSSRRWLSGFDECDWCGVSCDNFNDLPPLNTTGCDTTDLQLENINQSGVLPTELGEAVELRTIRFEDGTIEGPLPPAWGDLNQLRVLDLNFQNLTGSIPPSYYKLLKLNQLDLNDNELTGTISNDIGNLKALEFLQVGNNKLAGTFPPNIASLTKLNVLGMENNKFSGSLPAKFVSPNLERVFLDNNLFTGPLTFLSALENYPALLFMDLSNNQFSSTIPTQMERATNLDFFDVSFNKLTGSMPPGMENNNIEFLSSDCGNPERVSCDFCTLCTDNP